jgi:D-alanyl-D-alanine dipeptidase
MSILVLSAAVQPSDSCGLDFSVLRQAVVVVTADWTAPQGIMQRYDRTLPAGVWHPVGEAIPVVVGRNGLGWGIGLHLEAAIKEPQDGGPEKREGDGRSPAGVFKLGSAFGYAPATEVTWIRLPYLEATSFLRCIDDPGSPHYNRLVDARMTTPNWGSDEEMRRGDDQYRLGVVVGHNDNPVVPGRGSCIFMHIWKGSEIGTAGCTAMSKENMALLLRWLDPTANPVLIQLPAAIYKRLQSAWGIP